MGLKIDLSGKTALVCGASRGIGAAAAQLLADQGATVYALARSENDLTKVVSALPGKGHKAIVLDVTDLSGLEARLRELTVSGPIEILVNNSGGPPGGPIANATASEFNVAFSQHLIVNSMLAQNLLPGMRERGYGRIINVISTSVKQPIPGLGVSNTVRAAVASWAKTLSLEVAAFGVTVNSVLPGYTKTARLEALLKNAAAKRGVAEETIAAEWRAQTPAGRFADATEVASVIAFLASPAASYVNGVALAVDGGRTGSL